LAVAKRSVFDQPDEVSVIQQWDQVIAMLVEVFPDAAT
jgi:hypothetical protein